MHKSKIPPDRLKDVTHGKFVHTIRPNKAKPNSNRINYPCDVRTPMAVMLCIKILLDNVISTNGAKFISIDISSFYLNTPLKCPKYMMSLKKLSMNTNSETR